MPAYRERLVDAFLADMLTGLPAVSLVGPRASGKTTTAMRHARTVLRLDEPRQAEAVSTDPDAALAGLEEPVLLDEWQEAPDVLGAVKRACDADPRPGRFILTGSVRGEVRTRSWPGTGRVTDIRMHPMTVGELASSPVPPLMDRIATGALESLKPTVLAEPDLNIRDYVDLAMASGFPYACLELSGSHRKEWLNGYVHKIVTRDSDTDDRRYDSQKLARFFSAYALGSATTMADATLCESSGIDRRTADRYLDLLNRIYVVDEIPAWSPNRLKRVVRAPKRMVADAALIAVAARAEAADVMLDSQLLGRMIETLVIAQLQAQADVSDRNIRLHHLRTHGGRQEIDLIAELTGGLMAVEVKSTGSPRADDTKHLEWFRDQTGDRFLAGMLLHAGPSIYQKSDRIWALPISALWKPLPGVDDGVDS